MNEDASAALQQALESKGADNLVAALRPIINWLRPADPAQPLTAEQRVSTLAETLTRREDLRTPLQALLRASLSQATHLPLHTEIGLFSRRGFIGEFGQRFYERLNPRPRDPGNLRDLLDQLFDRPDDPEWVTAVPDAAWLTLFDALGPSAGATDPACERAREQALYAVEMLSLWVAAEELEPELLRLDPGLAERDSPFVAQEREVAGYIRAYNQWLEEADAPCPDDGHARALLEQCREQLDHFHRRAVTLGSTIGLTHLLARLEQTLERIVTLLDILSPASGAQRRQVAVRLFKSLVRENARQTSLRALWQDNTHLVARSITEQASKTGEHYITEDRRDYLGMLRAGAGAGLIIGFMALIKIRLVEMGLSPGWETVWVSLNYGLGFVLIHILHFTVATKQPAMTAARLAAVIETGDQGAADRRKLAQLLLQVGRSQFAAVVGNVSVALPIALLVGWLSISAFNTPALSPGQADYLMEGLRPLMGLALLHAAIAGVWLFVAGLIAGFFDNRAAYLDLARRLRGNPHLARVLPDGPRARIADYLDQHYGALAGNFLFGVLLGTTGYAGYLIGLPLDIQHVAFGSANLGYAATVLDPGPALFLLYLGFVLLIGAVNLWVSFGLALHVALRARGVRLGNLRALARAYGQALREAPRTFLFPPGDAPDHPRD
ncbi:site-specific recombinase [Alkalilimnicola ehrlichii MLHE-1]|nr:site-specific recombinase [Alkalilimnicola ehrlichii]